MRRIVSLFASPRAALAGCLLFSLALAPAAFAQDVDPPVISVTESGVALASGSLFNRAVTPVVDVTDASPPVVVDLTMDGAAFTSGGTVSGEGARQLVVTATDDASNVASVTIDFEIDTVAPVFVSVSPEDGALTAASELTITGDVAGADAVTVDGVAASLAGGSFSAGPFPLAEGETTFSIVASDAAGNSTARAHRAVRDSTPPAVSVSQPATGAVVGASPVDVVGSVADAHLASVTVNGTVAVVTGGTFVARNVPLAEGDTPLVATATDAAGNSAQASRTVNLDTQPPAIAVTDPAAGTVTPVATLTVTGTAADPHLDRVEVSGVTATLAAGAGGSSTWSASVPLAEGSNTITATAWDLLGRSTAASVAVERDSTAPAISIVTPGDGAYLPATETDVSGTVVEEPDLSVTVNGLAAALTGGDWDATAVPLVEGENRLIARVTDGLGNQGTHTRVVYRDTEAPQLLASDPGDGALAVPPGAAFALTFSEPMADPAAGDWRLELADGTPVAATATLAADLLTVRPDADLASEADLRLVLTAALTDLAGNPLETPPTLVYTVADVEAPPAPALSATPPAYLCASSVVLAGSAEAEGVVEATGGAAAASVRAAADGSFSLTVVLRPAALNHVEVTVRDVDGNTSPATVVDLVQDCAGPSVAETSMVGELFSVVFDEAVAAASLATAGAVAVSDVSGPVAGTVAATAADAATFTPDAPLSGGPFRLVVSSAVTDLAGNPLAFPYSEVFGAGVETSFLAGRVVDAATGRPLGGARVVVETSDGIPTSDPQPEQTTADDGRFRIPVPPGTHSLVVSRDGYTPAFRVVTSSGGYGADVFDPRLTPAADTVTIGAAGGDFGVPAAPSLGPALAVPAAALAADAEVAATALDEQALPALLPYGWSPRGAVWLDLGGEALAAATLSFPVDAADGTSLVVASLDAVTLQWTARAEVTVFDGAVTVSVGDTVPGEGAWAAVEPDLAPTAPPAATVGAVLGSATAPLGDEATAAAIVFDPAQVLPAQSSRATVTYTLAADAASGLAVTVTVRETLTLLDGTVRTGAPFDVDAVVYRAADGTPRSRFWLRPSLEAARLPIELGAEDVSVRLYAGQTVRGNVLGPLGGTVTDPEGDRVDLPAGALPEPTAVLLARLVQGDLATALPAGFDFLGLLDLDLSGRTLAAPAALTLELGAAPAAGEEGLLFQVIDLGAGAGPQLRPVAALAATASGWTTAAIDPLDLPWPGVRDAGRYLFARSTGDLAFLRGTVYAVGGGASAGAWISGGVDATALDWIQVAGTAAGEEGTYVLPAPLGAAAVAAQEPATGDLGLGNATLAADGERVDLDLFLALTGPTVLSTTPADGAVDVPPGIEPTVTFSEAVDPATLAAGVLLYEGSDLVPVDLELSGTLVRVVPRATLKPAAVYELRLTTALKDLVGNRLPAQVTVGFTTLDTSANELLDPSRIHLFEPDGTGMAQVLGRSGAVPGGALVFVENLSRLISTPSVTSQADGSFSLTVEAALDDTLLLHVLVTGQNEIVFELTPFLAAGGLGAHVGRQGATFTTLEDLTVTVEPGTFLTDTLVTAEMRPATSPAPVPADFQVVAAFELDFGGAEAQKALGIELPKPAGVAATAENDGELLLAKIWRLFGADYWMLHDFLRIDGEVLTTALPPEQQAALRLRAPYATAVDQLASTLPYGGPLASPQGGGLEPVAAPSQLGDRKDYLPGSANPGLYVVMENQTYLDFVAFPVAAGSYAYFHQTALDGHVAVVNGHIDRLLAYDAVLIPTRQGEQYSIDARELDTGFRFFEGTFDPVPAGGEVEILPPDLYGDTEPAVPVSGSPLRFFLLLPTQAVTREIDRGLSYELDLGVAGGTPMLSVTGAAGAVAPQAELRLLGLDDAVDVTMDAAADGAVTLSAQVTVGNRYLLAVGAVLGVDDDLEITFSEGLHADLGGIHVDKMEGGQAKVQSPDVEPVGTTQTVRISPQPGWVAGATYRLRLTKALMDGVLNSWDRELTVAFRIAGSRELDTFELQAVRDVERLGNWLFVAADTEGFLVLDGSDPAALTNAVSTDVRFPFPLGDPVTSVDVDPHGRVLVAGGGVNGFGQLKIFDPLAFDPAAVAAATDPAVLYAAFRGSTVVSDSTTTGTSLPEGRPRHVTVFSEDDEDGWRIGFDAPPTGVTLEPATPPASGEWAVTVSGTDGTPGHPVTLHDRSRGRWRRVDAASDGSWSIALNVVPGDRVELLRNRQTLAYLATLGVGIQVVDVDAFYGETQEDWDNPSTISDLVGTYTGYGDSGLRLCQQAVSDIGSSLVDLGTLGNDPSHPLTLVGLIAFKGLGFFESEPGDVGDIGLYNETCIQVGGSAAQVFGLEIAEDYPFDFDGDGVLEDEERRDYVIVAHRNQGVLVFDVTNRDGVTLAGHVRLPGVAERVGLDRENRLLYVSGSGGGIYVVDFDTVPSPDPVDADGDGVDERILETIALSGITNSQVFVFPELGLAYAGGLDRGLTSIGVGGPRLQAVVDVAGAAEDVPGLPRLRTVHRLAPLGVPTAPESSAAGAPSLPAAFQVLAELPGVAGNSVRLDVVSLGAGGLPIDPPGDPALIAGLPPVALTGDDGLLFTRLASNPWEDGYQKFISEEIVALADLRAAGDYTLTAAEDAACTRCDATEEGVGTGAREILSGETIAVRFPASLRAILAGSYDAPTLDRAELELASVRWETAPSTDQEPTLSPSLGSGDVAPGTLLHSGEYRHSAADMAVPGVGLDFLFRRYYRNQTVGSGPLGPGWDHGYRVRLRELPDGDIEHFDGSGLRETFALDDDGGYVAPAGRFVELTKNRTGWMLLGAHGSRVRFDAWGRLVSISDPVKISAETGNEMRFRYDLSGRLVEVEDSLERSYRLDYDAAGRLTELRDFEGRRVAYAYDSLGRLEKVTSPNVLTGVTTFPNGLDTVYAYETPTGDLDDRLTTGDNLASITDPKEQAWLQLAWGDVHFNGRYEQLVGQTWGDDALSIAYSPGIEQTVVTDRRGKPWTYDHDAAGHPKKVTDPTGAISRFEYDGEGLLTKATAPLGRVTEYQYEPDGGERRARGNLRTIVETPDARGANGAPGAWTTAIEYHASNLPSKVTDPQGGVTLIQRHESGLPAAVRQAYGTSIVSVTSYEYDDRGRVKRETNPNQHEVSYRYHESGPSRGYLERMTVDPDGLSLVSRYEQDARGNVVAVIDPRGVRHTTTYNELDWVIEAVAAVTGTYETLGDSAPPLNYVHQWLHDANGNVIEERTPIDDGDQHAATIFTYGTLDELLTTSHTATPPNQVVADIRDYDANLNLEWYTGPDGTVTHLVYDDRNLVTGRRSGFGTSVEVLESFAFDADGQLVTFTDGNGHLWTREYDGFGRLAGTLDPLSNKTEILYSESVTSPLAFRVETRHRDAADVQLARSKVEIDLLGRTATETRDWWEGPISLDAYPLVTSYVYDPVGNLKTVSIGAPIDQVTQFEYDAAERLESEIDPAGNETLRVLNRVGQPEELHLTSGAGDLLESTYFEYDALGRTIALKDALGNEQVVHYDAADNPTEIVDAEGHLISVRKFDSLGRLFEEAKPEGRVIRILYDAASRPTHYEDALGSVTVFGYDVLGRLETTTLPDSSVWLRTYDGVGTVKTWTDPNGTFVEQQYDALGRLSDRTVTPATGIIGPTSEHYEYDGLSRLTKATSGLVTVDRVYDSLAIMRSETTSLGSRTIEVLPDEATRAMEMLLPSSYKLRREYDALGQLEQVQEVTGPAGSETFSPLAGFDYLGPGVRAGKQAGALAASRVFDASRRPIGESAATPVGLESFGEQTRWTPRGLKSARARTDLNGKGHLYAYDDSGRLARQALAGSAASGASNNVPLAAASLEDLPHYDFQVDQVDNLVQRTFEDSSRIEGISTPRDGSGRNRPGSVNGLLLTYDANGNLTQKGELAYEYDYRNRLTRISDSGGGIVSYTYDAFDRRVQKEFPSTSLVEQTVWSGWRPIELYRNGQLAERRVYGAGLDEIVALQQDTDGDGVLDATRVPWYDSTGNLVVMTRPDGSILERYDYTPMGEGEVRVDLNPPVIERLVVGPTSLEILLSEEANQDRAEDSVVNDDVQLVEDSTGDEIEIDLSGFDFESGFFSVASANTAEAETEGLASATAGQTVSSLSSRNALRRQLLFTVADPPAAGTPVTLTVASPAIVDSFHNPLAAPYTVSFAWPASETIVADSAPPRVEGVHLVDGHLEVTFSEDPDASTVPSALNVGDPSVTWTASPDGYTYRSDQTFVPGTYSLTVDTTLLDRGGQALAAPFVLPFELETATLKLVLYEAPDPTLVSDSTVGNLFGFHGLERDPESGLYYVRHRYFDPELGRFITPDPFGYTDGPNTYQYALNDPVNLTDPMGLQHDTHYPLWQAEHGAPGPEDVHSGGVPPSLASAAGYTVGLGESGIKLAWSLVTSPWVQPVRHFQRTRDRYSIARAAYAEDRWAGVGYRLQQFREQDREAEQMLLRAIPGVNTFQEGSEVLATYEEHGPFEGGRQLGRTFFSLGSDLALGYGAVKGGAALRRSSGSRGLGDVSTSPWLADRRLAIVQHLEQFRGGGSFLVPRSAYERFIRGRSLVGRGDGQFITTRVAMDRLLAETGGDIGTLGRRLGTNWREPLVRIDIPNPLLHNARLPSGLELGADAQLFRWGGYTSGGLPEIVIDRVPAGAFNVTGIGP